MGVRDRAMSLAQRLSQTKFDRGDERGHGAQDHSDRVAWSPFCWGVGTYPAEASHGVPPPSLRCCGHLQYRRGRWATVSWFGSSNKDTR